MSVVQKGNAYAGVMELADVTDSKSVDGDIVWVRVPPPAPKNPARKCGIFYFFTFHSSLFTFHSSLRAGFFEGKR